MPQKLCPSAGGANGVSKHFPAFSFSIHIFLCMAWPFAVLHFVRTHITVTQISSSAPKSVKMLLYDYLLFMGIIFLSFLEVHLRKPCTYLKPFPLCTCWPRIIRPPCFCACTRFPQSISYSSFSVHPTPRRQCCSGGSPSPPFFLTSGNGV